MKVGIFQNKYGGWSMIFPTGETCGNYATKEKAREVAELYNAYNTYICECVTLEGIDSPEDKAHFGKCPECGCGFVILNNSTPTRVDFSAKACQDACPKCCKYATLHMYEIIKSKISEAARLIMKGSFK